MAGKDDERIPEKTRFEPSGRSGTEPPARTPQVTRFEPTGLPGQPIRRTPLPVESERTEFEASQPPRASGAAPSSASRPSPTPSSASGVPIGSQLNHMFEVTRFIARGGMGEVFEGVNVTNGERVAIKVILPALAADPNVIALFRKEAQALTKLSHQALVRYRVQAQDPGLGCHYIVTGFIDGMSLSDALGKLRPSVAELVGLTRRLAEGLKEAHDLGVVHRDISPDNVLLENDRLDLARIIDFGIVKDTSPEAHTIIGDGFAGKLRYAAPEQLGDYNQNVGPWSDIYSLGLVILALAQGKSTDLTGSPAEAIRKRRAGIDTSGAPDALRPIIDKMVAAEPEQRFQSMGELITALAKVKIPREKPKKEPKPDGQAAAGFWPPTRNMLIAGGVLTVLLIGGAIAALTLGGGSQQAPTTAPSAAAIVTTASIADVDAKVKATLPSLPCSWVSVNATSGPSGITLTGSGVAGRPADVESGLFNAVRGSGGSGANVSSSDFSAVSPIDASFCPMLDELRKIHSTDTTHLTSSQSRYELGTMTEGQYEGQKGASVIVDLSLEGIQGDFALYAIEKAAEISEVVPSRAVFLSAAQDNQAIEKLPGNDRYRLKLDGTPSPGWAGILLITGKGGFSEKLLSDLASHGGQAQFEKAAAANGWKAEIVWYKFVDDEVDAALPVPTAAASEPAPQ